ncbi:cation exchanger 9 [Tanacetum coccineum]
MTRTLSEFESGSLHLVPRTRGTMLMTRDPDSYLLKMSTTMELILAKCECCGLTEECTFEYIYKIRERYHGKWICGLCGEAIKDKIARGEKLISTKEAMVRLINFCKESKPSNKMTEPTIHLIAAMRQIMLRSLDSLRALRSMPNSPLRSTDKIKLSRSDSCIANLSLETSYTTLQEIMK